MNKIRQKMRFSFYSALKWGLALTVGLSVSACGDLDLLDNPEAIASGADSEPAAVGSASEQGQTLLAVYMIGSNLEDGDGDPERGGAGTADLNEMVSAYQTLSAEQQHNVNLLVGFGGANQAGWQGIRYADTACLLQDSQDGIYGNDSCYAASDESANMGDATTLQDFMSYVGQNAGTAAKKIFAFWDHGASYMGVGPDSNFQQDGILTMGDLRSAFTGSQSGFDIIGFDACLMGSIEVAQAVHPYGRYMVASEELEPGHGWDYEELVSYMGQNPQASVVALGKKFVDSFIDSPKHQGPYSNSKTLSLVDLGKFEPVATALDGLSQTLEANLQTSYEPVLQAASRAEAYGVQNQNSVEMGVDLKDFAQQLKTEQPQLAGDLDALTQSLDSYVIYSKRDASKPHANGVSIFSPRYPNPVENDLYSEEAAASRSWRTYAQDFVKRGQNDTQAPVIESEVENCADGFHCLTITDDVGISEAVSINALQDPALPDEFYITSTINMDITANKAEGVYGLFIWDGTAPVICDGACADDLSNGLEIPVNVENLTEDGDLLASADGSLNGKQVVFYMVAGDKGVKEIWAVPYSVDAQGNVALSREQLTVGQGDALTFSYQKLNAQTEALSYEESDVLTLHSAPVFDDVALPGVRFYFALASDLKGNVAVSDPHLVE